MGTAPEAMGMRKQDQANIDDAIKQHIAQVGGCAILAGFEGLATAEQLDREANFGTLVIPGGEIPESDMADFLGMTVRFAAASRFDDHQLGRPLTSLSEQEAAQHLVTDPAGLVKEALATLKQPRLSQAV